MIRVILEQGLLQLFDQVLKPLDRERIRRPVQESVEKEDPALLRELIREISFVGPLQRSVASWADAFRDDEDLGEGGDVEPGARRAQGPPEAAGDSEGDP